VVSSSPPNATSFDAIRAMASEVFVLGYPLVLTDAVRRAHPVGAGRILFLPDDPRGLAPGFDGEDLNTVLTSAWIDLEAGPVVLQTPDPEGRHFSLTLFDPSGAIIASFGAPSGHAAGGAFMIVGPEWRGQAPPDRPVVRAPAGSVWAITRITAASPEDRSRTRLLAAQQHLATVDALGRPESETAPLSLDPSSVSSVQRVLEMAPDTFLHRLGMLLDRAGAAHAPIRAALTALQDATQQVGGSRDARQAILHGFEDGFAAIRRAAEGPAIDPQGEWRASAPLSVAEAPLSHAAYAFRALGAPAADHVLTLACHTDETGRPLQGSERYRIHFPPGETPPIEAFWSITVSPGGRGYERTSIGSRDKLSFNRDGSLDLILQPMWPGASHAANWLATPERDFGLTLKMYGPRPAALDGDWRVPPVERLGSRFAGGAASSATRNSPKSPEPPPDGPAQAIGGGRSSVIVEKKSMRTLLATAGFALAAGLAPIPSEGAPAAPPTKAAPAAASAEAKLDPAALQALKRMSAYLGTLSKFELTADTTLDLVMDDGEKIQQSGITTYKVRRPDGLVIDMAWDRKARQYIYDGKKLTVYAPKLGYYAQADAPPTIRETLEKVYNKYGIALPLEDLFYWAETGDKALAPPDEGYYVGTSNLNGVETDQYAFRDGDLDWQIWIEKDDTPVPRKVVITDRSDDAKPQYVARLTWNTNPTLDAATFAFKPDANARAIKMAGN
jgi:hypothetical protein